MFFTHGYSSFAPFGAIPAVMPFAGSDASLSSGLQVPSLSYLH
jgi:hypothetical protein